MGRPLTTHASPNFSLPDKMSTSTSSSTGTFSLLSVYEARVVELEEVAFELTSALSTLRGSHDDVVADAARLHAELSGALTALSVAAGSGAGGDSTAESAETVSKET